MNEARPMMLMKVSMERCCEGLTVKGREKQGGVQRRGKVFYDPHLYRVAAEVRPTCQRTMPGTL